MVMCAAWKSILFTILFPLEPKCPPAAKVALQGLHVPVSPLRCHSLVSFEHLFCPCSSSQEIFSESRFYFPFQNPDREAADGCNWLVWSVALVAEGSVECLCQRCTITPFLLVYTDQGRRPQPPTHLTTPTFLGHSWRLHQATCAGNRKGVQRSKIKREINFQRRCE